MVISEAHHHHGVADRREKDVTVRTTAKPTIKLYNSKYLIHWGVMMASALFFSAL